MCRLSQYAALTDLHLVVRDAVAELEDEWADPPTVATVANRVRQPDAVVRRCLSELAAAGLLIYAPTKGVAESWGDRLYHQARPHQRKENKPLLGVWTEIDDPPESGEEVVCRVRLGGVLKHYERKAV